MLARFESAIYEPPHWKKPSRETYGIVISLLLAAIGYLIMLIQNQEFNWLIFLGGMSLVCSRYLGIGEEPILGDYLGEIILEKDKVTILDSTFSIDEIKLFKIEFASYKKKRISCTHTLYYYLSGTENKITIHTKDQKLSHNFMVLNRNHKTDIIETLAHYYEQGLFVREYGDGRTYLGEQLDYEEIQTFKKKYNLKGTGYENY